MKKAKLAGAALAVAIGLSAFTPMVWADETFRVDDFFRVADKDKSGMVSKKEFMNAMGDRYDRMMAKMKSMPDGAKMTKGDAMTRDGIKMLVDDIYKGA